MTNPSTPLTVYKASAGSGKTFTLAVEYIKLLILDPQNYRYILAVTFTNKATDEMKKRIMGQLYGIAHALDDSEDYMDQLRAAYPQLPDHEIRTRAAQAMNLILHHYHYFRVETIDSFFQSILRNLARELELTANLQVGLNDAEVESQAVDNLIENIEQDNDPLLKWIMDYVSEKMEDEKNWNVIGQIKDFGRFIFTDFYKSHQRELRAIMDDPAFFQHYTSTLRAMKAEARKVMAAQAAQYRRIVADHGLCDKHFYQGAKNAPGYFAKLEAGQFADDKLPNSYVQRAIDDPTALVKKADANTSEGQTIISLIGPLLQQTEPLRQQMSRRVNSIDLTLEHINQLRLLGRIEKEVAAINTANNNYPLSNTQQLLSDLIDRQDSPFIYEKTGGQLKYIMIDEFQDTSTVQWSNFKVLLDDCLAHHSGSLIVGDVKQSIYRWRNGDWRLLQALTPANDARVGEKHLDTNYRSKRNVIRFNNAFFSIAARVTADNSMAALQQAGAPATLLREAHDIRGAYADVCQQVAARQLGDPDAQAGSVTIRLLPKKNYEDNMLLEVAHMLETVLSAGIPPKKVAIVVRKNKHIQLIAKYFQQHAITVGGSQQMVSMVSDEAFRLDASLAVCTIVRAMRLLTHPDDRLTAAALVKAYHKICLGDASAADSRLYVGRDDLRPLLPQAMLDRWDQLLTTPLIDLAEQLYQIFQLQRLDGQSAYICAFFDQLSLFMQNHIAGMDEFLAEWDTTISGKSIHSDEVNGIRLLTIHKSKGLEFDNVIIPYCDWDIEKSDDVLWVSPRHEPYSLLPVVPVSLQAKRLRNSIYSDDYESEHLKNLVDNLNMLYVAFTRAGRNLFVIGSNEGQREPSALIGSVVNYRGADPTAAVSPTGDTPPDISLADLLPGHTVETGDDGTLTFAYGTLCLSEEKQRKASLNVFEQTEQGMRIPIRNYKLKASFRQSNESTDFITPDEELEQQEQRRTYIQTGNILHALFASIESRDDIDRAIDQLEFDGTLYDRPMTRSELSRMIHERIGTPAVAQWFDPRWQVFNECAIITFDEAAGRVKELRPDRVVYDGQQMIVVDFKTGAEREEHHTQVKRYTALLRRMGYPRVSGHLWYIRTNRIVDVDV